MKALAICLALLPIGAVAQDTPLVMTIEAQNTYETVLRAHARDYVAVRNVTTTHRPHVMTWRRRDGERLSLVDTLALRTFEPTCIAGQLEDVTRDVSVYSFVIRFECNSARVTIFGQHSPPKSE